MIWTDEQDTTLRTMRDEGRSYADIGKALGVTRNAISGRVNRLKLEARTAEYSAQMRWHGHADAKAWTPEEDDTLARLRAENMLDADIASRLGRSLRSIKGRVARLGLRPKKAYRRPAMSLPKPFTYRKGVVTEPRFFAVVEAPDSVPVGLMSRTGCCYPVTESKPHLFCNAKKERGDYCEFHRAIMYRMAA